MNGFADYHGFTHPVPMALLPLWKRWMCKRNVHAFDEVAWAYENYLICDACELMVYIADVRAARGDGAE